jgi:hypothetical protein
MAGLRELIRPRIGTPSFGTKNEFGPIIPLKNIDEFEDDDAPAQRDSLLFAWELQLLLRVLGVPSVSCVDDAGVMLWLKIDTTQEIFLIAEYALYVSPGKIHIADLKYVTKDARALFISITNTYVDEC